MVVFCRDGTRLRGAAAIFSQPVGMTQRLLGAMVRNSVPKSLEKHETQVYQYADILFRSDEKRLSLEDLDRSRALSAALESVGAHRSTPAALDGRGTRVS